jgi:methylphosphotriester-DNA--protein-cysteine methyltransferase
MKYLARQAIADEPDADSRRLVLDAFDARGRFAHSHGMPPAGPRRNESMQRIADELDSTRSAVVSAEARFV